MSNEIHDLFKRYDVLLERDDVWSIQSTKVVKHKALERLGAKLHIKWQAPQVLRAERDEAVILVTGEIEATGQCEWSIGEALVNGNYRVSGKQAAYVYAMAEKRAKDRVILKLAGLHGVYSEDEADDFKQSNSRPEPDPAEAHAMAQADIFIEAMKTALSTDDLADWVKQNKPAIEALPDLSQDLIRDAFRVKRAELSEAE